MGLRSYDKKQDWADLIENEIAAEYGSHGALLAADADGMIADALRKAKADGVRQTAQLLQGCKEFLHLAEKIERGEQ